MKYDVFISYSRKDLQFAEEVCAVFDKYREHYSFSYFYDKEAITGRQEYLKKISAAILESKMVLFLSSENSTKSEFCSKELNFADKRNKPIYQYCIDKSELPPDIDLLLCNQQYREVSSFSIEEMVREVLSKELGFSITEISASSSIETTASIAQTTNHLAESDTKVEAEPNFSDSDLSLKAVAKGVAIATQAPLAAPMMIASEMVKIATTTLKIPECKYYKVGDYYDDGTKRGVVFKVTDEGLHGKIVSLEQTMCEWTRELEIRNGHHSNYVGALSTSNGLYNNHKIREIINWDSKYPAFVWCAKKGVDWYLPAIEDLELLLLNEYTHKQVNSTLNKKGLEELYKRGTNVFYWSSTEHEGYDGTCAKVVYMRNGNIINFDKSYGNYVRAICDF